MRTALPRVFLGSSSEGEDAAREVEYHLQGVAEVTHWRDGQFALTRALIHSLQDALENYDFAILVLTPDDAIVSRGQSHAVPRDNVVFELGLFLGRLGPQRTFAIAPEENRPKLPSDLDGVLVGTWATRSDGNLRSAVAPICTEIRRVIRESGPVGGRRIDPIVGVWDGRIDWTHAWADRLFNYDGTKPVQLANPHSDGTVHIYSLDDGEYKAFSLWTLVNGFEAYAKLAVTPENIKFDDSGRPRSFELVTAFRQQLRDFAYAPFSRYLLQFEHVAERMMSGTVYSVCGDGALEKAGSICLRTSHQ